MLPQKLTHLLQVKTLSMTSTEFEQAAADALKLRGLSQAQMLQLYALYKQVSRQRFEGATAYDDRIVSYRIVSYRIASHPIASHRIVSYRIVSYRIVSYRIVSYRIVSCRIVYRVSCIVYRVSCIVYRVSHRIASHRIASHRIVSYHIISYHIISYHIISYCIVLYCIIASPALLPSFRQLPVGPQPDLADGKWPEKTIANMAQSWMSGPGPFVRQLCAPLLLIHGSVSRDSTGIAALPHRTASPTHPRWHTVSPLALVPMSRTAMSSRR
eukprot:g35043.t1